MRMMTTMLTIKIMIMFIIANIESRKAEKITRKTIITNKFEWTLNNIRIEKISQAPIWATKFFLEVSDILDVRHCPKLESCTISRKTNDATLTKWQKP